MNSYINYLLSIIGSIYSYTLSFVYKENTDDISIHGNFVKIPYLYENKRYYTIIPIHKEQKKVELVKELIDSKVPDNIFINHIIDCVIKLNNQEDEINVMDEIERYMGPDQFYKEHIDLIRVSDILPLDLCNTFEYMTITFDDCETRTIHDINENIFTRNND